MKGIRWKIIVAIMVIIAGVCTIFTNRLIHYSQTKLEEKITAKEEASRLLTRAVMEQVSTLNRARINSFVQHKASLTKESYINAFARQDRQHLLELTLPFFQLLERENPYFASLAWILPNNRIFLRLQDPGFYNDDVSGYRPDIVHVNQEHEQVSGFDVGPYGMQYRTVQPIWYNGTYIGAVQFGIKASQLFDTLQKHLNIPAGLAVLSEEYKSEQFSPLPKIVCGKYTVQARDISLFKQAEKQLDFAKDRQIITVNNKQYVLLTAMMLKNYAQEPVGKIVIALNISDELAAKRELFFSAVFLSLGICLVSFLILYYSIGILLRKIVSLNDSLRQSNKTLEERVAQRTQSLQETIAEHIATEQELRNSNQRYQTVFNNSGDAIAIIDLEGNFITVNNELCQRLGYSYDEIMKMQPSDVIHRNEAKQIPDFIEHIVEHGSIIVESEHLPRTGDPIPTEFQASLIEFDCKPALISVARDIRERKKRQAEKDLLEIQLRRSKKMKAIGLMAGGVAHDLNNILAGIISYPELLLMQLPPESNLRDSLLAIKQSGEQAAAVVADLLTVARGVASSREATSLNTLITAYLRAPEFKKLLELYPGFRCEPNLAPDLLNVSCSSIHLSKCFMNLVTNAAEAINGTGQVTITTGNEYVDKPDADRDFLKRGEYVFVKVHDTGSGISVQDQEHIFEPFYSKKVMGRSGTGLGLAVVWNTVRDHDGSITVDSGDNGTTFTLYFPATREAIPLRQEDTKIADLHGKGEKILIIDDEPRQQDIGTKILTELGYTVFSVSSGKQALEFLRETAVDLLLLDMIMEPGINGLETYRRILALHPGQRAVIASGFSKSRDVEETLRLGAGIFIKKPYTLQQLGKAVYTELNKQ